MKKKKKVIKTVDSVKQCTGDYLFFFFCLVKRFMIKVSRWCYTRTPHTTFCFVCRKAKLVVYTIALFCVKKENKTKKKHDKHDPLSFFLFSGYDTTINICVHQTHTDKSLNVKPLRTPSPAYIINDL